MRVLLASGGTGGHIFPALALARELVSRGHEVMFVTDTRGAGMISKEWRVETIPATAFFGRSVKDKFRAIGGYLKGKRKSARIMDEFKPDAVVGAGGYASFPAIKAARSRRVGVFLLEQNSVPGRVTRMLARRAREIYCGIPPVRTLKGKVVITGNVLRKEVIVKNRREGARILVLGGSGGARRLSELGYELAKKMPLERFIVLTGRRDYHQMKEKPPLKNLEWVEFTARPEELYRQAKIAVSRAGAVALSELLANGIPSILVPFPYAIDDHQTHNAHWAAGALAAVLVREAEIARVEAEIEKLLADEKMRTRMSVAGRELVPTDAASRIAVRMEKCLAG